MGIVDLNSIRAQEEAIVKYREAVDFLSGLVDHERKTAMAKDLSLEPVRSLLNELGNPHSQLFIIHVAGTKGKGSVSYMLEAILRQAGYRTGLYTSPDLCGFEERFRINGEQITHQALGETVGQIERALRSADVSKLLPSRFDVATALAFLHFASNRVDVAIIEVGMGGRTDSTNICTPQISVITSISYDHTRQLGNTLTLIATEKAGIIKSERPTVSGVVAPEARVVLEAVCQERGSRLSQLGVDFSFTFTPGQIGLTETVPSQVLITTRNREWPRIALRLLGEHQATNAAIAIATVEQLQELGLKISDQHVVEAMLRVQCPARIEIVRTRPLVILDCAHNIASVQALVTTLQASAPGYMNTDMPTGFKRTLIFGSSWDKDLAGMLSILCPHFEHVYLTQYSRSNRCATRKELLDAIHTSQVKIGTTYVDNPEEAWKRAEADASDSDLLCVTGSIFLAGEIRELFFR